ncbi:hypothetical protein [Saccharopolyspora sp. CA-218241]|uniref:hypothetical protein n=1 Tax=Saccharopolyspora sp. CA-218241 TaxID=3240027 RepID=UPI003D95C19C
MIPLLVIATAQLMLVLDDSIVTIALPSIQQALGVDPVRLPWIVNGYILAFGALLLLGDLWGRKRTLQVGLLVFVLGSLAGGFGQNAEMLIAGVAATVTTGSGDPTPQPLVDGYSTALIVGAGILLAAALLALSGRANAVEQTAHTAELTAARNPVQG